MYNIKQRLSNLTALEKAITYAVFNIILVWLYIQLLFTDYLL